MEITVRKAFRIWAFALVWSSLIIQPAAAMDTNAVLNSWLASQKELKTWSADFKQTRTLKSFSQPLSSTGHVWFAAPDRFRWELGNQTIAVRQPDQMLVIYPRLKRVEKFPLTGERMGQWKDMLALLEAGFPRDRAELETRFRIVSVMEQGKGVEVALQPKASSARKMMPSMKLGFSPQDQALLWTELQFADGSTMRNDFDNPHLNETFAPDRFEPALGPDYKVVEPMRQR